MSIIVNGVELTEVIYAGVNLDIVKVKKGTAEAVTVFEKITQLATPQNVTANGTTVSWDAVENATSYAVLADGNEIGTVEKGAEQDELAGTWVFNDTLEFDSLNIPPDEGISFYLEFVSSKYNFVGISVGNYSNFNLYVLTYSRRRLPNEPSTDEDCYFSESVEDEGIVKGWSDNSFKTITITSKLSEVTDGETLLAWLQANATKQ